MVWHANLYSIAFLCMCFSNLSAAAIVPYNIERTLYNSEVKYSNLHRELLGDPLLVDLIYIKYRLKQT
jgi:hypothetical protein